MIAATPLQIPGLGRGENADLYKLSAVYTRLKGTSSKRAHIMDNLSIHRGCVKPLWDKPIAHYL